MRFRPLAYHLLTGSLRLVPHQPALCRFFDQVTARFYHHRLRALRVTTGTAGYRQITYGGTDVAALAAIARRRLREIHAQKA